jgi:DNA-binding transcriptional ArsR family regulator
MQTRRDVFQAIADPTRRVILGLLAAQTLTLNSVAENFAISRPAISRHIKILKECGLVETQQRGREHYCKAKLNKLAEISDWLGQYRQFWENKLDSFENYINILQAKKKKNDKTK